ncbi:hypothetical protein M1M38_gp102 [Halorubrum tailed virus 27]|uniref:Uncharacterized protein n=1 Tax=Halorubrum tailed virus 27 TaxID=2878008 RepID=A0AAE9BXR2_9CAUD|nr:hypothetical protein M1M38_gp102 [Halorubrum tailed virus 27]UBF22795.1 hypothetical protein HRTV-27_gp102 [Halorubrum tailed virus 27]
MTTYIISIDNLFKIDAPSETEAYDKLRERIEAGELFDGTDPALVTIEAE